jgi:hypothetical protein
LCRAPGLVRQRRQRYRQILGLTRAARRWQAPIFYPPVLDAATKRPCHGPNISEILTTSIRACDNNADNTAPIALCHKIDAVAGWELFRKGLEDVERFYQLQSLLASAPATHRGLPCEWRPRELDQLVSGCEKTLRGINQLVWDFPAMKRQPWGDGYAPRGWSVLQEDEPYSTNVEFLSETLHSVAQCIETLTIRLGR